MNTLVYIAIIAGGVWLVKRATSLKGALAAALCVLVLLGLVVSSHG